MRVGVILTVTYWCSSAMQDCPSGSDLYIPESVVRRVLLNAQWVTLGGRRFMTCSFPSVPACKVMETAVWSRCQGHYQRKGLPAVAPSHRKLPTHPNKERHKCRGGGDIRQLNLTIPFFMCTSQVCMGLSKTKSAPYAPGIHTFLESLKL